jgi:outer membrane protein OmpA-like peptidoglycan-associated protein
MQLSNSIKIASSAAALVLALTVSGFGQTSSNPPGTAAASPSAAANTPSATGQQPLEMQSHEGFWGHMNPMARKKWVNRQTEPIKGRLNELDQLTAKNASDIHDLDVRATAGIKAASDTANAANQTATDAGNRATQAQTAAQGAAGQADKLNTTVSNLDQYKAVTDAEVHFAPGSTVLSKKSKAALSDLADQLNGQKGYILQVEGFTHTRGQSGVSASDRMATSVVRYLVEKKNVPIYKIYKMGYGSARPEGVTVGRGNVVQVTLMHNSLSDMNASGATAASGSPIGATQPSNTASPETAAPQPANTN